MSRKAVSKCFKCYFKQGRSILENVSLEIKKLSMFCTRLNLEMIKKSKKRQRKTSICCCTCKFQTSLYFLFKEVKVGPGEGNQIALVKPDLRVRMRSLAGTTSSPCCTQFVTCVVKECVKILVSKQCKLIHSVEWIPTSRFEWGWLVFPWALRHAADVYMYIFIASF